MIDFSFSYPFFTICAGLILIIGLVSVAAIFLKLRPQNKTEKAIPDGTTKNGSEKASGPTQEVEEAKGLNCSACGAHNPVGNNFCEQCGTKL